MEDRSYIPYYYGLNYEAPPGVGNQGAFLSRGLGLLAGRAMRQGVVGGADAGLWLERLAGVPLEPERMMIDWGGTERSGATEEGGNVYEGGFTNPYRFGETSFDQNPKRFIDKSDPNYQESIFAEPSELPVMDTGGLGGVLKKLAGREALLAKRQGLIDKVKGIKGDYDRMIAESAKITGLAPKGKDTLFLWESLNEAQLAKINQTSARLLQDAGVDLSNIRSVRPKDPKSSALLDLYIQTSKEFGSEMTGEEFYRQIKYAFGNDKDTLRFLDAAGFTDIKAESKREYIRKTLKDMEVGEIEKHLLGGAGKSLDDSIFKAYDTLRAKEGYSSLPIAQIRDMAGVSQAEIEAFIKKLADEGKVALSRGDWSLSNEHIRSGVIPMGMDPALKEPYKYLLVKFNR